MSTDVAVRIRYGDSISVDEVVLKLGGSVRLDLVHRRDYHEDGSTTDTFMLELEGEEFDKLGGERVK